MSVLISERFNAETGDYGQLRKRILKQLDRICSKFKGILVVGPRVLGCSKWIFLEVTAGNAQIVLAICAETLYLYAWRRGNLPDNNNHWCVTRGDIVELPSGQRSIPFGGSYCELGGPESIPIDRSLLCGAVQLLYNSAGDPINVQAGTGKAFLMMIVVFCAGLRIIPIYRSIYKFLCPQNSPKKLSAEDKIREKNWKGFSEGYMLGNDEDVVGFGKPTDDMAKNNVSVLLYHSTGTYDPKTTPGWVLPPGPPDDDKKKHKKKGTEKSYEISLKTGGVVVGHKIEMPSGSRTSKVTDNMTSLGCTVIKMVAGLPPWSGRYERVAASFSLGTTKPHPLMPEHLPSEAKVFLRKCLQFVNPMSEPSERWPCKFDINPQQRTLSSEDLTAGHYGTDRSTSKKADYSDANGFSFPINAACQDINEVSESKIRAFVDEKGASILVDNEVYLKLADFGAWKQVAKLATMTDAKAMKFKLYWMVAPEVILQGDHNFSTDVWSVDCTVIEMFADKPPWSGRYQRVAASFSLGTTMSHPFMPEHLPSEAKVFLHKCLQFVNRMSGPSERWPCKFDISPQQRTLSSEDLTAGHYGTDRSTSKKTDYSDANGFSFPINAACQDINEVSESKIRAFVDEKVAAFFHVGTTESHAPIPNHFSEAKDFLLKCLQSYGF